MDTNKKYDSLSLKYRSVVLEREIHDDAMSIAVAGFLQELNDALDSLGSETKEKYNQLSEKKKNKEIVVPPAEEPEKQPVDSSEEPEKPPPPIEEPAPIEHTSTSDLIDPRYKEVFRKIALHLHPDRLVDKSKKEKQEKTELFKEVQSALSNGDYSTLLSTASILDIDLGEAKEEDLTFLKELIGSEEAKITKMRDSWAWNWYHENNTSKKEDIMLLYVSTVLKK